MDIIITIKIISALGIFNVWMLRYNKMTEYRGGNAKSLKEEFETYGLKSWQMYIIGAIKIIISILFIVSCFSEYVNMLDFAVFYGAAIMSLIMIGAILMHLKLNDPFKSAEILQAHVDEGLKLARRNRLPSPIADFIPEHQGTLKMGYFLHKARETDSSIQENRFRYKGPIPASRETGILMLAVGCEAALRALDTKSSYEEACKTIRKM